jgi:hypothetical protein
MVALDSVVDLHGVYPAHQRSVADELLDAFVRGAFAVEPRKDCPRVQADGHSGSRERSSSRRRAMPLCANRPPSPG